MPNVTDYLTWRGDLTVDERPVNDADALAIACAAYLDIRPFARGAAGTLGDACRDLLARADQAGASGAPGGAGGAGEAGDVSPFVRSMASIDRGFVQALAASRRLGEATLRRVADVVDEATATQFAAIEVDVSPEVTFVAFRGTDTTLVGWRENFLLGSRVTNAQVLAAGFLRDALARAVKRGARVCVTGHSKGGALADCACAVCPAELRDRVARCWSLDGPGLERALVPTCAADVLGDRFSRIQPAYSVVGALFDRPGTVRRHVASVARGLLQHDPMSWQTTPTGLLPAEADPAAAPLDAALNDWIDSVAMPERVQLTDELFSVLGAGGASTLDEVLGSPRATQQVLAAAIAASPTTKLLVTRLLSAAAGGHVGAAREWVAEGAASAGRAVGEAISDALESATSAIAQRARDRARDARAAADAAKTPGAADALGATDDPAPASSFPDGSTVLPRHDG